MTTSTTNVKTSTPNTSIGNIEEETGQSPDVSVIENNLILTISSGDSTKLNLTDSEEELMRQCVASRCQDQPTSTCRLIGQPKFKSVLKDKPISTCVMKGQPVSTCTCKEKLAQGQSTSAGISRNSNTQDTDKKTTRKNKCKDKNAQNSSLRQSTWCKCKNEHAKDTEKENTAWTCTCKPKRAKEQPCTSKQKHISIETPPLEKMDSEEVEELFYNNKTGESSATGFGQHVLTACADQCGLKFESQSEVTLPKLNPKIKQELKSNSLNVVAKESVCGFSAADSPSSCCASARAHYYQNKLLATLQILQNKEETVRVQAESLAVAESRITSLTARGAELKKEIERKGRELQTLRKALEENIKEKTDVSVIAHVQEMENQKNIVSTLQNNLSVIEDLYRDCFYETVKQENHIEMLRKSYLDVRLLDKEKTDQITKLHDVITTQKWSLDRCQDMATEVDNLKMEIFNFINSSNNDSGMWEESIAGELYEDLQDIAAQLLRLGELLIGDCTCGLREENIRLKENNQIMERNIGDLRQKIYELEENLENKDKLNKKYHEQIESKDNELISVRTHLMSLQQNVKENTSACDNLTLQLNQTQVLLKEKTAELQKMQKQCEECKATIRSMREPIEKSEQIVKENVSLRNELCAASHRCARLQRHAQALEEEAARARQHCLRVDAYYKVKATSVAELETQLTKAHSRGAELSAEVRRVVRALRGWARRMRDSHREHEQQIKQKESELNVLQQRLEQKQSEIVSRISKTEQLFRPCMSSFSLEGRQRDTPGDDQSEMEATCSKRLTQRNEGSLPSVCVRERRGNGVGTSASEMESSSTSVPPKICLKKKSTCVIKRHGWPGPSSRDACVQLPARRDAHCGTPRDPPRHAPPLCDCDQPPSPRQLLPSPGEEMFSRLENISDALADGYRRWSARRPTT